MGFPFLVSFSQDNLDIFTSVPWIKWRKLHQQHQSQWQKTARTCAPAIWFKCDPMKQSTGDRRISEPPTISPKEFNIRWPAWFPQLYTFPTHPKKATMNWQARVCYHVVLVLGHVRSATIWTYLLAHRYYYKSVRCGQTSYLGDLQTNLQRFIISHTPEN